MTVLLAKMVSGEEIIFSTSYSYSEFEALRAVQEPVVLHNPRTLPQMTRWLEHLSNDCIIQPFHIIVCQPEEEASPIIAERYKNLPSMGW